MTDVSTNMDEAQNRDYIEFVAHGECYCVEIKVVREIRRWTAATKIPRSPEFVTGVINLRGAIVPVIDFSARLGKGAAEPNERHSIVIVEMNDSLFGLLVDAVSDVLTVAESELKSPPGSVRADADLIVDNIIVVQERMICVVNVHTVVGGAELSEPTAA